MNATFLRNCLMFATAACLTASALAGPVLDRVRAAGRVRVCIWSDYYGVTYRNPRTLALTGIDIDLSAQFGADIGARVEHVESSFDTLIADVTGDRCDVAMFAVGRLPQRMAHLRFTQPYLQSDIYGITTKGNRVVRAWQDIDKPGVLVGVQAGTFMEAVLTASMKRAEIIVIKPPAVRERELEAGRIDVFMTDYPYSRRLLDNAEWAMLIEPTKPFHVLPYAYAVKPGDDAWLDLLDKFVARIKVDGRLARAARAHGLSAIALTQ